MAFAIRAHPKADAGAHNIFLDDAAVPLSIPGKNLWQVALYLGAGGEGAAALFVQFDERNNVQDRIAVKEVTCRPENWWFPFSWAGAYDPIDGYRDYSAKIDHSEASETYIHRKLSKKISDCILEYRGRSRVYTHQWRWRLYSEFCAHGTLQSLLQHYQEIKNFPSAQEFMWNGKASDLPDVLIPEPFIWYCASSLAKAAQVMYKGSDAAASEGGWREVIHRDIKPGNVFLSEPSAAQGAAWPLYPAVKLADFGHSVETNAFDPPTNNPRSYRSISGTAGFIPPEQRYEWHYRGTRDPYDALRLSAKSNVSRVALFSNFIGDVWSADPSQVYSIGMTLWALIYRHNPNVECDFSHASDYSSAADLLKLLVNPGDHGLAGDGYSQALIELVQDCIRADPRARPSPQQLQARVEANSALFESMRTVVPTPGEPWYSNSSGGEQVLAGLKQDNYRLGLARENLPSDVFDLSDSSDASVGSS